MLDAKKGKLSKEVRDPNDKNALLLSSSQTCQIKKQMLEKIPAGADERT